MIKKIVAFFFICMFSVTILCAQNKPKKDAYIPEDSPEEEIQEQEGEAKKEKEAKPQTKSQIRRAMRSRDNKRDANYKEHHERVQQEKTYDRMKKNSKRAKYINGNKKPNAIQRLMLRGRKK